MPSFKIVAFLILSASVSSNAARPHLASLRHGDDGGVDVDHQYEEHTEHRSSNQQSPEATRSLLRNTDHKHLNRHLQRNNGGRNNGGNNGGGNNNGGNNGGNAGAIGSTESNESNDSLDNVINIMNINNNDNESSTTDNSDNTIGGGDLNIRFSKVANRATGIAIAPPLQMSDYPIGGSLAVTLSTQTDAVSVMTSDDYEIAGINVEAYINANGGPPTHVNSDPSHPFWDDFRAVVEAQVHRLANGNPLDYLTLPALWNGYNIDQIAQNVRSDYPGYWQGKLVESFFGGVAAIDYNVLPFRSVVDFVGGNVRMATINSWTVAQVAPVNFRAKWIAGRARPEEIAHQIKTGVIPETSVPADIKTAIDNMDFSNAREFTAYPEGSPSHPSWPAMHSAVGSSAFWTSVVFDLTDEQYCQALLTDYIVSFGRTVAGVHYPSDNIAGLNLGQDVVADRLVSYLVGTYGANREATQAKVNAKRFDWNTFNPATCTVN